jgi:hypothetical protein
LSMSARTSSSAITCSKFISSSLHCASAFRSVSPPWSRRLSPGRAARDARGVSRGRPQLAHASASEIWPQASVGQRTSAIQELVHLLSDPREQLLLVLSQFRLCSATAEWACVSQLNGPFNEHGALVAQRSTRTWNSSSTCAFSASYIRFMYAVRRFLVPCACCSRLSRSFCSTASSAASPSC